MRVVVNVARSQTGRFPNPGPLLLVRGGVRLIDAPGAPLFDELSDGEDVSVRGASVFRNGTCVANGRTLGAEELAPGAGRAAEPRDRGARGVRREHAALPARRGRLLAEGVEFPPLETRFRDRHALVVARGPGLQARPARSSGPTCATSSRCSSASTAARTRCWPRGMKPHVIVGDMDSVSDGALRCGAELVVHAYRRRRRARRAAARPARLPYSSVSAPGISEDIALLLAFEKGAELIVAVGTHFNLTEFLERDRAGMSSTFVTRLKVGEILIDAKGVSRLVSRQVGLWPLILFAAAGLGAVVVAIVASPGLRHFIGLLSQRIRDLLGLG